MTTATAPSPVMAVHVPPSAVTMAESGMMSPRKLKDDDEDEERGVLMQGGPFENAKRKCSYSANSMRKELGSPRMSTADTHAHDGFGFESSNANNSSSNKHQNPQNPQPPQLPHHHQPPGQQRQQPPPTSHLLSCANAAYTGSGCAELRRKDTGCGASRRSAASTGTTFLQELGSALVSCGGGGTGRERRGSIGDATANTKTTAGTMYTGGSGTYPGDLMTVATSWVRLKDSFQKAVKGDLDAAKEAWRRSTQPDMMEDHIFGSVYSHDSILTYDNYSVAHRQAYCPQQEEEAMQLRRLTSWGTVGTCETMDTNSVIHAEALAKAANRKGAGAPVLEDDDGVPIDVHLLQTRGKKLALKNKTPQRKRVVRFDYPPISSLRECPRTQPDQIEELFFTEHELEQIEDDRYSTISADDVEIVAISTSTTTESDSCDDENKANMANTTAQNTTINAKQHSSISDASPSNNAQNSFHCTDDPSGDAGFRGYVSTPSKGKQGKKGKRSNFSFDGPSVGTSNSHESAMQNNHNKNDKKLRRRRSSMDTPTSRGTPKGCSTPSHNPSSRRMIKSVQIYLRERSVG